MFTLFLSSHLFIHCALPKRTFPPVSNLLLDCSCIFSAEPTLHHAVTSRCGIMLQCQERFLKFSRRTDPYTRRGFMNGNRGEIPLHQNGTDTEVIRRILTRYRPRPWPQSFTPLNNKTLVYLYEVCVSQSIHTSQCTLPLPDLSLQPDIPVSHPSYKPTNTDESYLQCPMLITRGIFTKKAKKLSLRLL